MKDNTLLIINRILRDNLRPWVDEYHLTEDAYKPLIRGLSIVETTFQQRYSIEFYRPFNACTQYYSKLIDNDMAEYCNGLIEATRDSSKNLKKYWMDSSLNKKLKTKIEDVGKIISASDYNLSYIDPQKNTFNIDSKHKESTFIIQYLKLSLIKAYLEIQSFYIDIIHKDDILDISDFYTRFLFEPIPNNVFIRENPEIIQIEETPIVAREKKTKPKTGVLSFVYVQLDSNPEAITDLFNSLKDVAGLIDSQTRLVDFKKVFSGREVVSPIIWTGTPTELYYFIKYIHNIQKSVEDARKQQWAIACHCFIGENEVRFEKSKLKSLKDPNPQSVENIKKAANNLSV